jgi:ankyrin repeat protein
MSEHKSTKEINNELCEACIYDDDLEKIDFLLSNGANVHHKNIFGNSPIILATFMGSIEITEKLILNGAYINDKNNNKDTPIILASLHGYIEIIQLLLSCGANINDKNKYNRTPIMAASKHGYIEIVKVLEKWPLSMLIIVLQELVVYHILDCSSFIDFNEYFGEIV